MQSTVSSCAPRIHFFFFFFFTFSSNARPSLDPHEFRYVEPTIGEQATSLSIYIYNASRGVIIDTDLIKKCLSQTPAAPDVPPWKPRKYYPAFRG